MSTTQGQPQVPVVTNLAAAANPAVGATLAATTASTIPEWSEVPMRMLNFSFSKTNELLQAIPGNEPIDYFRAIFDDQIVGQIVEETNTYADEVFLSHGAFETS